MKLIALIFSIALLATMLLAALPVSAIQLTPIVPTECRGEAIQSKPGGCTLCHIAVMAMNITNFAMFAIAIPAVALLVAIGGITLLISGGSETMVSRGRKTLTYTIAGALIVFLAWLAVDTTIKVLTGDLRTLVIDPAGRLGPWNRVDPAGCPL